MGLSRGALVGSRGDAYDDALAESVIALFTTEVIRHAGPWAARMTSSMRRWNGWRGSTRAVCSNRSGAFRQRSMRINLIDSSQHLRLLGYSTN